MANGDCPIKKSSLVTARAVVQPKLNAVPVRILNLTEEPVVVHRDTKLAELEKLEETMVAGIEPTTNASPQSSCVTDQKRQLLWGLVEGADAELSSEEKETFFHLLLEYADVFAESDEDLGHTDMLEHSIYTGDSPPVRKRVRRIPPHRKEELHQLLQGMLDREVVQP